MKGERKTIMKTTKIKVMGYRLWAIGLIVLLPMLVNAVEYKSTYCGTSKPTFGIATTATAPTATFQSTSAYSSQWQNTQTQSMLNSDGSVNSSEYMTTSAPSRPRRVDANHDGYDDVTGLPVNPIIDPNDPGNVPLGDGLFLLALLAVGYAARKRTSILES